VSGDSATLWIAIAAVGAANYLSRLSFIALLARRSIPPLAARALRYVAVAMLTALVLPMVLAPHGGAMDWTDARVPAVAIAGIVAFFTRSTAWTLVAGMAALWAIRAIA
jgi:branched-subunit amino acid transport protein